jgi:hypothetical protein
LKNRNLKPIEIVRDSLFYPLDIKSYIGLLILFSTSFLIVPGILAWGYLIRIIYRTSEVMMSIRSLMIG